MGAHAVMAARALLARSTGVKRAGPWGPLPALARPGPARGRHETPEIDALMANRRLDREAWLAQAETVELVSAQEALRVAERVLEQR